MALAKCPDCGKMVSNRAKLCPDCGCPQEYFELVEENMWDEVEGEEDFEDENDFDDEEDFEDEDDFKDEEIWEEFSLLGYSIVYPKCAEPYIIAMKAHADSAARGERELKKIYTKVNDMDKVWDEVIPAAQYMIDKIVKENVGILYQGNNYITEDDFKKKYNVDIKIYIQEMMDAYDEIIYAAKELQQARGYERANRSTWQGGGFGLKGAIKGAVTAGALNAVTEVGRAIGDSMVDNGDNAKIQKKKQEIYNNEIYQNQILGGFRRCVAKADIGLAEMLADSGATERIEVNYEEATKRIIAAQEYEKDESRLARKAVESLCLYPLEPEFYKPLIAEVFEKAEEDIDDLLRFMEFWKMKEDFVVIFEQAHKREHVNEYFEQHPEAKEVNFEDYRPATYMRLRDIRSDLRQAVGSEELPVIVPYCNYLNIYFENCLNREFCLDSIEVLKGINETSPIEDFLQAIHNEKTVLPGLLNEIWVRGDSRDIPEAKLKSKWELPQQDTVYMYQNQAVFGTVFGGKGFVLTNSVLCDLETKTMIQLKHIIQMEYDDTDFKVIISDGKNEIRIDLRTEKVATRRFFFDCLQAFITRYVSLTEEERHLLEVNKCVKRMQEIVTLYAKRNGIEDADLLLEEFLMRKEVLKPVPKTIFCLYCGKQIVRSAKFCNFCGKTNNYNN